MLFMKQKPVCAKGIRAKRLRSQLTGLYRGSTYKLTLFFMLVLSRQRDESIHIGDDIVVTVVDIRGDRVRIGIKAPREVSVCRREVYEIMQREKSQQKREEQPDSSDSQNPAGG